MLEFAINMYPPKIKSSGTTVYATKYDNWHWISVVSLDSKIFLKARLAAKRERQNDPLTLSCHMSFLHSEEPTLFYIAVVSFDFKPLITILAKPLLHCLHNHILRPIIGIAYAPMFETSIRKSVLIFRTFIFEYPSALSCWRNTKVILQRRNLIYPVLSIYYIMAYTCNF